MEQVDENLNQSMAARHLLDCKCYWILTKTVELIYWPNKNGSVSKIIIIIIIVILGIDLENQKNF